jgi:hypothetical protein
MLWILSIILTASLFEPISCSAQQKKEIATPIENFLADIVNSPGKMTMTETHKLKPKLSVSYSAELVLVRDLKGEFGQGEKNVKVGLTISQSTSSIGAMGYAYVASEEIPGLLDAIDFIENAAQRMVSKPLATPASAKGNPDLELNYSTKYGFQIRANLKSDKIKVWMKATGGEEVKLEPKKLQTLKHHLLEAKRFADRLSN